jgi:pimeloyl-ACP methyl ester carboxylesterase
MTVPDRLIRLVSVLLVFVASCNSSNDPSLDRLVDVGTHHLYIHCLGSGTPTIVIDTGVGEKYDSWQAIISTLSRETRVCAYDRAGYGRSEPGPMPRDSQRAADELHLLLANAGEDGPFLLVGHSLGGLNLQVYANSYPKEVAGLILLDPSPLAWMRGKGFPKLREIFDQETKAQREAANAAKASSDPEARAIAPFLDATASEFEQFFGRTADEVAAIQSFGELPLTVIGASEPDSRFGEDAQAFRLFWNEESRALARKSGSGRFILAEGSGHYIYRDTPQVAIDAILDMIQ